MREKEREREPKDKRMSGGRCQKRKDMTSNFQMAFLKDNKRRIEHYAPVNFWTILLFIHSLNPLSLLMYCW